MNNRCYKMKIITVTNKSEMKSFVHLPQIIYKNNPCYIPPIWLDENNAYSGKGNPILENSDFELFLAIDEAGVAVGRTIAYIDFNHNKFYKVKMGFFGAFECIDNQDAGKMLVKAAEKWLRKKGMETIRGPIHPVAENWGFVYEGYENPPVYMSPWNPPFYNNFFTDSGYEKAKDLLVYEIDMDKGYTLPGRYSSFYTKFMKRYPNIKIRRLDMKNIKKDAKCLHASILKNEASFFG